MANYRLLMPKLGESVIEATVLSWHKKAGDSITEHEVVLEVATDKVDTDIPSPVSGVIKETRFHEGDVVPVGEVLAIIETDSPLAGDDADLDQADTTEQVETAVPSIPAANTEIVEPIKSNPEQVSEAVPFVPPVSPGKTPPATGGRYYSPLVLNIAQTEGIPLAELEHVPGTGLEGRITKDDILHYIAHRPAKRNIVQENQPAVQYTEKTKPSTETTAAQEFFRSGEDQVIEMDRMRKLISKNMIASRQTSAHVSSIIEADLTHVVQWREKHKKSFQLREGFNLTYMPVFVEAIVKAIKDFPMINISVYGEKIIKKHNINIGIATALPSGNLIVPVIKNADLLSLGGLAAAINTLVQKARNNSLAIDDIEGGTYTITNIGTFGTIIGTPIIPQPQVAIMAVGAIAKKPVVLETKEGDVIAIRHMMYLSHTYDHRVVDGMLGGQFVKRVAEYLEQFDVSREV